MEKVTWQYIYIIVWRNNFCITKKPYSRLEERSGNLSPVEYSTKTDQNIQNNEKPETNAVRPPNNPFQITSLELLLQNFPS